MIKQIIHPGTPLKLNGTYLVIFGGNGLYDINIQMLVLDILPDMSRKDIQELGQTANEIFSIVKYEEE